MVRKNQSQAERTVDRAQSLYEELKVVHKCDPFAIMAAFATGNIKALGMTARDSDDVGSRPEALLIISPELRFQAAKELAGYCKPKLAATTFLGVDGNPSKSRVIVYVPDNGRGPT